MRRELRIDFTDPDKAIVSAEEHRRYFGEIARSCVTQTGKHDVRLFGDKTPEHTMRVDVIRRLYPECRLLFVYRDPRDVALSLQHVPWMKSGLRSAAALWVRYNQVLVDLIASGDRMTLAVRYEDLVHYPVDTLRTVCRFLDLPHESALAVYDGVPTQVPKRELGWESKALSAIDPSRVGRWQTQLTHQEAATVERIAGVLMPNLSYDRVRSTAGSPGVFDRMVLGYQLPRMAASLTYQCLLAEARYRLLTSP